MSSNHEPHPIIAKISEGDGISPDRYEPEQWRTHQSAKFLLHTPRERIEALEQLDSAIGRDDGTTLRRKAELLQLRAEMRKTHAQLLALKR